MTGFCAVLNGACLGLRVYNRLGNLCHQWGGVKIRELAPDHPPGQTNSLLQPLKQAVDAFGELPLCKRR